MKKTLTPKARDLRTRQTDAEAILWRALRDRRLDGFKFKRQVPCGRYIVDFLCAEAGLIIEVDGGQHAEAQARRDEIRTGFLEKEDFRVLRFWNNEVLGNIEGVLVSIRQALLDCRAPSPQPSPPRGEGVLGHASSSPSPPGGEGRGEGFLDD
jgi:adenine-specific DNA-methyltransferase